MTTITPIEQEIYCNLLREIQKRIDEVRSEKKFIVEDLRVFYYYSEAGIPIIEITRSNNKITGGTEDCIKNIFTKETKFSLDTLWNKIREVIKDKSTCLQLTVPDQECNKKQIINGITCYRYECLSIFIN